MCRHQNFIKYIRMYVHVRMEAAPLPTAIAHSPGNTAMKIWHDARDSNQSKHQVHDSTAQYCTLEQRAPWKHTYILQSNPCTVQWWQHSWAYMNELPLWLSSWPLSGYTMLPQWLLLGLQLWHPLGLQCIAEELHCCAEAHRLCHWQGQLVQMVW